MVVVLSFFLVYRSEAWIELVDREWIVEDGSLERNKTESKKGNDKWEEEEEYVRRCMVEKRVHSNIIII